MQRSISVLRRRRYSRFPWLDAVLARLDLARWHLALQLQQAGVPLRAGEFLFLQLVLATMLGLVGARGRLGDLRRSARGARRSR